MKALMTVIWATNINMFSWKEHCYNIVSGQNFKNSLNSANRLKEKDTQNI